MMNLVRLALCLLVFFLFACGNSQQNNAAANAVVKTDSIKPLDSIKVENMATTTTSGKSMNELLKSGEKGVFQDSTFAAIIEDDFAVGIRLNVGGRIYRSYDVTSYLKELGIWKVKEVKTITSRLDSPDDTAEIKLEDMDKDGKEDIMLLMSADGRGNEQYTLFLIKDKNLIEVRGFSDLPAPIYDEKKKMISSTSSYHGGSTIEFYRLAKDTVIFVEGIENLYGRNGVGGQTSSRKFTVKE
jgi:hypothetical protein